MKKTALFAAIFVLVLLLTRIANQVPPDVPPGVTFSLRAQQVVQCSETEITLVDNHQKATHLEHDASWPDCSAYQKGDTFDFYLSRADKTHFLRMEKTSFWRKIM